MMINVVCMALLGMSVLQWEGVSTEADVNSAVLIMQLVALICKSALDVRVDLEDNKALGSLVNPTVEEGQCRNRQ